ncbi:FtsX-like permease family protein [Radiobacillus deserti]|uniref:FtsX-like permease family protein n=1 Tax=Radiobacillus deserti TaxID=2594883 RepID=A0A516KC75_9BACI|nr:FtsX-like permease family protein [Radiobacillus deserti]QDP39008.1 FtsX-like permease family protein [Radiobacillus deserti]
MLVKLSLASMRKMFKDYLVLLFGLTISISIFYMFETLAQNRAFLESNAMIGSIVFVFHVGSFILGTITVFYIFYATSFILSLRQKEMGMYLTFGAKKSKVAQLMFFETFVIGLISLIVGLAIGVGLSQVIADLLMNQLDFSGEGFKPLYTSSVVTTVLFYVILFFITSLTNGLKIARKSVLDLIHAGQKSDTIIATGKRTFLGVFFSIILMAVGYYAMINMGSLAQMGLIIATATIIPGTYLLFISLLPYFMKRLKGMRSLNEKGINSFTFAQLRFRIHQLTKVLGTVAMLVALGLGAMTASLSFYNNIEKQAALFHGNDLFIHQPSEQDLEMLEKMDVKNQNEYRYKLNEEGIYFLKKDLLENPPTVRQFDPNMTDYPVPKTLDVELPKDRYALHAKDGMTEIPKEWTMAFQTELSVDETMFGNKPIYIYSQEAYNSVEGKEKHVLLLQLDDFTEHLDQIKTIVNGQKKLAKNLTGTEPEMLGTKYDNYLGFKAIANGTIFMGVFLGIAFLMMMASVLMFKLLSGAPVDVQRYSMLRKIGVRRSLLSKSIYKELFLVFLFPALVGLVHVIVGMQMFSFILVEPYTKIWLPLSLFIIIYFGIYYLLTVQLYKRIVLPKEK